MRPVLSILVVLVVGACVSAGVAGPADTGGFGPLAVDTADRTVVAEVARRVLWCAEEELVGKGKPGALDEQIALAQRLARRTVAVYERAQDRGYSSADEEENLSRLALGLVTAARLQRYLGGLLERPAVHADALSVCEMVVEQLQGQLRAWVPRLDRTAVSPDSWAANKPLNDCLGHLERLVAILSTAKTALGGKSASEPLRHVVEAAKVATHALYCVADASATYRDWEADWTQADQGMGSFFAVLYGYQVQPGMGDPTFADNALPLRSGQGSDAEIERRYRDEKQQRHFERAYVHKALVLYRAAKSRDAGPLEESAFFMRMGSYTPPTWVRRIAGAVARGRLEITVPAKLRDLGYSEMGDVRPRGTHSADIRSPVFELDPAFDLQPADEETIRKQLVQDGVTATATDDTIKNLKMVAARERSQVLQVTKEMKAAQQRAREARSANQGPLVPTTEESALVQEWLEVVRSPGSAGSPFPADEYLRGLRIMALARGSTVAREHQRVMNLVRTVDRTTP